MSVDGQSEEKEEQREREYVNDSGSPAGVEESVWTTAACLSSPTAPQTQTPELLQMTAALSNPALSLIRRLSPDDHRRPTY